MTGTVDDPEWPATDEAVREHYRRAAPVYDSLASLDDEHPTFGVVGNAGWYTREPVTDATLLDAGWTERGRMRPLGDAWDTLVGELEAETRTLYNLTSWNAPDADTVSVGRQADDGTEWRGDSPTPDPATLRGYGFWLDGDLADDVAREELSDDERATVERALEVMIDAVADLYGVPTSAVYALDSGGGTYIYAPPEAALTIAEAFDDAEDRRAVFNAVGNRLREWGDSELWNRVTAEAPDAADLLDPDSVQNPNRQSKAPLSIHSDHDIVCTPLRSRDPDSGEVAGAVDYTPTRVSEVTDRLVAETEAWAAGLTSADHTDSVDDLVANLFPEAYREADGWREALTSVIENSGTGEASVSAPNGDGAEYDGEWFDREAAADALEHIDPDVSYTKWRNIGFALADEFPQSVARSLFVGWSRSGSKWDSDAERQAEDIISRGSGSVGVGTLIHHAKVAGWDHSKHTPAQDRTPSGDHPDSVSEAGEDSGGSDDGISPRALPEEARCTPKQPAGDLKAMGGCYGYRVEHETDDGPIVEWYQVTNFLLETLEFIKTDDGEEIRLRVHPAHDAEAPYEVTVEPTVFNEARQFKSEVVTGRTTQFENQRSSTLNELRETVGAQAAPEREAVEHVGAAEPDLERFVTPEGVLTADGMDDDTDVRYYSKTADSEDEASIVGEKWALETTEYDPEAVQKALRDLPDTRLPAQAVAALGWFYSAPAKPLIHEIEGEFNHLHVRGKTESGKTSFLELLTEAFGMEPSPWSASATAFSLEQLHVGSRGPPVWIDEYKPADMHNRTVDTLHRYMRMATRESIRTKGRPDQSHIKFRMQSPIVLSGEQQIGEAAVRRRVVQVSLSARATEHDEHIAAYSRLAGEPYEAEGGETRLPPGVDLRHHARAYYKFLAERDADELRQVWQASGETAVRLLDDAGLSLRGSERQGAQTVVFGYRLLKRFASEHGVGDGDLPDEADLRAALRHIAENVGAGGQRREHGDEFLELVAQAANAGYVMNADGAADSDAAPGYRVYNASTTPDETLALHLPTVYPAVQRYVRDYNIEDENNLLAKDDYLDEYADVAEKPDSHITGVSQTTRIGGARKRCVHVDPYAVRDRLGGSFDLSAFGLSVEDDETEGEADDDGGDGDGAPGVEIGATPLADVAEDPTGYPDVVAEVASVSHPGGEETPALRATLLDDSTALDLISWDDPNIVAEGDRVALENVGTTTFDGSTQLVYRERVTDVTHVGESSGVDPSDGPDSSETEQDKLKPAEGGGDGDERATTDGGTEAASADAGAADGPSDGDPDRPPGPHDDAQCRACGRYWPVDADDAPTDECRGCGTPIDWEWNVETGRVPEAKVPDGALAVADQAHDDAPADAREAVLRTARDLGEADSKPALVGTAAGRADHSADVLADTVDALLAAGRLVEQPDGSLTTGG